MLNFFKNFLNELLSYFKKLLNLKTSKGKNLKRTIIEFLCRFIEQKQRASKNKEQAKKHFKCK